MRRTRTVTHPDAKLDLLPVHIHLVDLRANGSRQVLLIRRIYAYPEVHSDGGRRLILRQPLLIRETQEEAALPDRRVPDEEELDVDRVGHEDRRRKSSRGYMQAMGYVTLLVLRGDDKATMSGRGEVVCGDERGWTSCVAARE
jgi:hypothetical protein